MQTIISQLYQEHRDIEQVLKSISATLAPSDVIDARICLFLVSAIAFLNEYESNVHHRRDEILFQRLQWLDSSLREVESRLLEQRGLLTDREQVIQRFLYNARRSHAETCRQLKRLVSEYIEAYRNYMAVEEGLLYQAAQHQFNAPDWQELGRGFMQVVDPVFGPKARQTYATLEKALLAYATG